MKVKTPTAVFANGTVELVIMMGKEIGVAMLSIGEIGVDMYLRFLNEL